MSKENVVQPNTIDDEMVHKMQELSDQFNLVMKEIENEQEQYWNSLSKDDQLKAFCAVVRRICKAEMVDKGSYRYALYQVFGFGPESYIQAQDAGYLALHNAIVDDDYDNRVLQAFCKKNGIENSEKKISEFGL
jgi:alanyl-tRNA synthetase